MSLCTAITQDGGRCKARAIKGSQWCYNHHPDHSEERQRHASKGGKRGGRGRPAKAEHQGLREIKKNSSPTLPLGFSPGRWNAAPPLPPTSLSIPLYELWSSNVGGRRLLNSKDASMPLRR